MRQGGERESVSPRTEDWAWPVLVPAASGRKGPWGPDPFLSPQMMTKSWGGTGPQGGAGLTLRSLRGWRGLETSSPGGRVVLPDFL